MIVDEEHRFGVKQKHKLKQITSAQPTGPVHYLAMSATPIAHSHGALRLEKGEPHHDTAAGIGGRSRPD